MPISPYRAYLCSLPLGLLLVFFWSPLGLLLVSSWSCSSWSFDFFHVLVFLHSPIGDHNKFFDRLLVPLPALISLHSPSSSPTFLLPFFLFFPFCPLALSPSPLSPIVGISSLAFPPPYLSFHAPLLLLSAFLLFCNCRTSSASAAAASPDDQLGRERGRGERGERGRGERGGGEGERGERGGEGERGRGERGGEGERGRGGEGERGRGSIPSIIDSDLLLLHNTASLPPLGRPHSGDHDIERQTRSIHGMESGRYQLGGRGEDSQHVEELFLFYQVSNTIKK